MGHIRKWKFSKGNRSQRILKHRTSCHTHSELKDKFLSLIEKVNIKEYFLCSCLSPCVMVPEIVNSFYSLSCSYLPFTQNNSREDLSAVKIFLMCFLGKKIRNLIIWIWFISSMELVACGFLGLLHDLTWFLSTGAMCRPAMCRLTGAMYRLISVPFFSSPLTAWKVIPSTKQSPSQVRQLQPLVWGISQPSMTERQDIG